MIKGKAIGAVRSLSHRQHVTPRTLPLQQPAQSHYIPHPGSGFVISLLLALPWERRRRSRGPPTPARILLPIPSWRTSKGWVAPLSVTFLTCKTGATRMPPSGEVTKRKLERVRGSGTQTGPASSLPPSSRPRWTTRCPPSPGVGKAVFLRPACSGIGGRHLGPVQGLPPETGLLYVRPRLVCSRSGADAWELGGDCDRAPELVTVGSAFGEGNPVAGGPRRPEGWCRKASAYPWGLCIERENNNNNKQQMELNPAPPAPKTGGKSSVAASAVASPYRGLHRNKVTGSPRHGGGSGTSVG